MEISPSSPHSKGSQDVFTLLLACMSTEVGIPKLPTLSIAVLPGVYAQWRWVFFMKCYILSYNWETQICSYFDVTDLVLWYVSWNFASAMRSISTFQIFNLGLEHWWKQDVVHVWPHMLMNLLLLTSILTTRICPQSFWDGWGKGTFQATIG